VIHITTAISLEFEVDSLFQRICDERQNLLILVQQQHYPEITQSFIAKAGARDKLEAFDLSEVCRIAEHVNVEEFSDIVMPCKRIFFLEGRLNSGSAILARQCTV